MINILVFYKGKNQQVLEAEKVFICMFDIYFALYLLSRGLRIAISAYYASKGTVI